MSAIWLELDRESLLVRVAAGVALADLERALAACGLSLDVDLAAAKGQTSAGEWIATGAAGARNAWLDPADHLIAGFSARIVANGEVFAVHPGPRRAVGPDLASLLVGMRGRWLALESVWLRVHRAGVARPRTAAFEGDEAAIDPTEAALFDAIDEALR